MEENERKLIWKEPVKTETRWKKMELEGLCKNENQMEKMELEGPYIIRNRWVKIKFGESAKKENLMEGKWNWKEPNSGKSGRDMR